MTVIQLDKLAFAHKRLAWLPLAEDIAALEEITVAVALRRDALRREHQYPFVAEGEKVRALPHKAERFFRLIQHTGVLPLAQIVGAVKTNMARFAVACADDHVPRIPFPPHFRIAKVVQAGRRIQHHPMTFKMDAVAAGGQALHLKQIGLIRGIAVKFMPGVDQRQRVAIDHRRAGKAAIFISRAFRCQRHRQMLPVQQIFTARMPPVHRPPLC